ncbi:HU family DNA-binding protein [Dysgonomonas sp. GY617]|nr:HU family DNA-binding protein [Dysgonomonas sp. GY617]
MYHTGSKKGEKVTFVDFGTFSVSERVARKGINSN